MTAQNKISDNITTLLAQPIDFLSHHFLGKPYIVNPQGEGVDAEFDSAPLYRFDGFDCVTFVNNILALSKSHDLKSFEKNLLKINYYHSEAKYENRFHFMSLDWNLQNQKNKMVRDVTFEIKDEKNNTIAEIAEGEIDKPNWFLKKSENRSFSKPKSDGMLSSGAAGVPLGDGCCEHESVPAPGFRKRSKENDVRKKLLKKYAAQFKKEIARIAYLPLTKLFDENKNPREFIFNQIPHESIIEIVRPNWNLKEKIGTNLHVSHVGFAIRKKSGELFFRHASSENKCVVEILLSDYLENYLESTTIQGINLQQIVE